MTGPTILAIESSCDETAAAVVKNGKVLNNIVATQLVHQNYGGVVPELASRAHQRNIVPVVAQAMSEASIAVEDLDAVAFTQGPGLLGSLLVGSSFAKSVALSQDIPLIGVHHMKAHIISHFIDEPYPNFPFICLTVSGGHTQLVRVDSPLHMEVLGETKDDAVGEAFDKAAKILGMPYPGGPLVDKHAASGDPFKYNFPRTEMPGNDYSFSGIKTALLYFVRDNSKNDLNFVNSNLADICASYQQALIDMLMKKLVKVSSELGISEIAVAGGVSANGALRKSLAQAANDKGWKLYLPAFEYCTDNAAMIAMNAHYLFQAGSFSDISAGPLPRMPF